MTDPVIDTVTPLWAWLTGLVFAVVAICVAEWLQRKRDRGELPPPRGPVPGDYDAGGPETYRDQLRPYGRDV